MVRRAELLAEPNLQLIFNRHFSLETVRTRHQAFKVERWRIGRSDPNAQLNVDVIPRLETLNIYMDPEDVRKGTWNARERVPALLLPN